MGAFSQISRSGIGSASIGAIPKNDSALKLVNHKGAGLGAISWTTGETWGVLISGAIVGVMAVTLFNRYYK